MEFVKLTIDNLPPENVPLALWLFYDLKSLVQPGVVDQVAYGYFQKSSFPDVLHGIFRISFFKGEASYYNPPQEGCDNIRWWEIANPDACQVKAWLPIHDILDEKLAMYKQKSPANVPGFPQNSGTFKKKVPKI